MLLPTVNSVHQTRTKFLVAVAGCYAVAFVSLWPQIAGLFGPRGILPAHAFADENLAPAEDKGEALNDWITSFRPGLVRTLPRMLGLRTDLAMDVMAIAGSLLACAIFIWPRLGTKATFFGLWLLYLSLFEVGQTFLWFQWDTLLLETGFLSIVVAPFWPWSRRSRTTAPWDGLNLALVRWLLFRMMFSSGCVKLTGHDPTWWGLTALPVHYESQCIPTPLAWFAFGRMPEYMHKVSVVATYFIEIPLTFLFFAPTRFLRKLTFWCQIMLMLTIMATGNYNFFNFLYVALCLSLADDSWWEQPIKKQGSCVGALLTAVRRLFNALAIAALVFVAVKFGFKFSKSTAWPEPRLMFTRTEFLSFVATASTTSVYLGFISIVFAGGMAMIDALNRLRESLVKGLGYVLLTALYVAVALLLFGVSLPRFLRGLGNHEIHDEIPSSVFELARRVDHLQISHSYGLFRSMTGVGGRPEIVIEGSDSSSEDGPHWREYHFAYKPGDVGAAPVFCLPHQPRLDWQMWFAALGTYQHNPWFVSLIYRILKNEPEVLSLLDRERLPFGDKAPKYVRAKLYHYHFSKGQSADSGLWWTRDLKNKAYFPTISLETNVLEQHLAKMGLAEGVSKAGRSSSNKALAGALIRVRKLVQSVQHHVLVWTICAVLILHKALKGWGIS